ncbi:hypothetical protein LIER_19022 [Lithospermum erythrorhizon]|uniref:Uncharacterized protein n=1 Tax=Lithospermum erythrorhizon TaxID=34254 RepID=A0AAV3QG60_LITER
MSQTSDEFVGSLLRDSPQASKVVVGSGFTSPNMDDSQGPLDMMPLRAVMGPPADVPPTRGSSIAQPKPLKGKRSKEPPTLDHVRAKTIPGLITEATECSYGLSLKWKEAEDSLAKFAEEKSSLEEHLNEALALADDAENKYEDLLAVHDGLIKSKTDLTDQYEADMASLKSSLEESQQTSHGLRTQLDSSKLLLADTKKRLEDLSLRPSLEAVFEDLSYRNLLIDNTVSLMKEFISEGYLEFRGYIPFFPNSGEDLGKGVRGGSD